jgi:hypothetical protein
MWLVDMALGLRYVGIHSSLGSACAVVVQQLIISKPDRLIKEWSHAAQFRLWAGQTDMCELSQCPCFSIRKPLCFSGLKTGTKQTGNIMVVCFHILCKTDQILQLLYTDDAIGLHKDDR